MFFCAQSCCLNANEASELKFDPCEEHEVNSVVKVHMEDPKIKKTSYEGDMPRLMLGKKETLVSQWSEKQGAPPGKAVPDSEEWMANAESPAPLPVLESPPPFGPAAGLLAVERELRAPLPEVVEASGEHGEQKLQESSGPMMKMVFLTNQGEEKEVQIVKRPLGAEFSKRPFANNATKVSKVLPGSHACALGLERGWAVKQVNGQDMTSKTFDETQKAIKKGIQELPVQLSS